MMRQSLVAIVAGLAAMASAQDQCYYEAGKAAPDEYIPCSSGGGISACCLAGDYCLEDGACYSSGTKMTYIAGCTDSTYSDGSCLGGDTCNKNTPFQGLALCNNQDWVCCQGQGQSGQIPGSDYSHDCPCDQDYGTAIANAVSLPAVQSLGTAFPSRASTTSAASTTSSGASSSAAKTTSGSASASTSGSTKHTAHPTTMATISAPISLNAGIQGTGSSSPTATSGPAPAPDNKNLKIGLGVGIPLGLALLGALGVALFCFRRKLLKREPQYVTQADLSTPVWVGETPGSGQPAPQESGAYTTAAGTGWKQQQSQAERTSGSYNGGMREVAQTPPPQYGGGAQDGTERPQSQGIWQQQRPS